MPDTYKLVATSGEQTIDVKQGSTLIVGRAVNSDVPIYDPTISRQHAQVSLQNGGVLVKDLGSSNGTFLNGSRITEAVAAPNDVVMFGKVSFYVREVAPPKAETAPAKPEKAAGTTGAQASSGFPQPKAPQATIVRQLAPDLMSSGRVRRLSMEEASPSTTQETQEAARSAKKLELLLEISKALSRQQDVDKLLESIADMSFQVMAVDRVSILMGQAGAEELLPRVNRS